MSEITIKSLAKDRGVPVEGLLVELRKNIKTLTKEEKAILTQLLTAKRGGVRKILSNKEATPVKSNNKSAGVSIHVKPKKNAQPEVLEIVEPTQKELDTLKAHKDSIVQSRKEENALSVQDKKRHKKTQENSAVLALKTEPIKATPESASKKIKTIAKKTDQKQEISGVVVIRKASANDGQVNAATLANRGKSNSASRKLKKKDKTRLSQKLREEKGQQHGFVKPVEKIIHNVKVTRMILVSDLAQQMNVKAAQVLKQMMGMGVIATINDTIDQDTAMLVVEEMGHKPIAHTNDTVEDIALSELGNIAQGNLSIRPPIVTIMGHVDHGKTSLLDYIRQTKIAKGEAGSITQHIGAYQVSTNNGKITFLDTPGHSAFSQMRSRGAGATDIVILVVAADDGVMPETIDSIKHAKASNATIIVAINKMDKEGADPDNVKKQLSSYEIIAEDWGGDVMMVEVSAHTGVGIDALLDVINLQAEILELDVVVDARAKGVVLEARLDKGRGKVTTLLVQEGTLKKGDIMVVGQEYGKVKQILSDTGKILKDAKPAMPVEILGLSGVPDAGDEFVVLETEKKAKEIADFRKEKNKQQRIQKQQAGKMEDFMLQMQEANKQKLNILLKADVRGSIQALVSALEDLSIDELSVNIVFSGVGGINDSDMSLAKTSSAIVLGFNVRADAVARKTGEREKVDVRYYSIIYNLIDDVKAMMSGLMAPEFSEKIVGLAQVKEVFKSKDLGEIAGCIVLEGKMKISNPIRILRDNVVIYEGELESLRRFKDEVKEVASGTECGIGVKDYNDVHTGDQIEVFERIETPVKL